MHLSCVWRTGKHWHAPVSKQKCLTVWTDRCLDKLGVNVSAVSVSYIYLVGVGGSQTLVLVVCSYLNLLMITSSTAANTRLMLRTASMWPYLGMWVQNGCCFLWMAYIANTGRCLLSVLSLSVNIHIWYAVVSDKLYLEEMNKLTADKHMEPASHSLPDIRIPPSILLWNLKAWRLGMCGFWQSVTRGTWGQDQEGEGGDRLCWRDAVSLQLRSNCMFIIVRVGCLLVTDCWCSNGMIIGQCQQWSTDCKVLFCLFHPHCLIHSTSEKKKIVRGIINQSEKTVTWMEICNVW